MLRLLTAAMALALTPSGVLAQEDRGREAREQIRKVVLEQRIKLTEIETTYDACDKGNDVTFLGRENGTGEFGKVTVKAGDLKLIELPTAVRELRWYCGGTRERVASGRDFDWVQIERAGNGALTWKLLKEQ